MKDITKEQLRELEDFKKWLKLYFKASDKEKDAIIVQITKENSLMVGWLQKIRNYDKKQQKQLLDSLVCVS